MHVRIEKYEVKTFANNSYRIAFTTLAVEPLKKADVSAKSKPWIVSRSQ